MRGRVVIGEGVREDAPMLSAGEFVGGSEGPVCIDLAVDPLARLRSLDCRITLIGDEDVLAALRVLTGEADLLAGPGGAPEGVLTACAVRSLNGDMQGSPAPQSAQERDVLREHDEQPDQPLRLDDLVSSDECCFVATGVTDSQILRAPTPTPAGWSSQSYVATPQLGNLSVDKSAPAK